MKTILNHLFTASLYLLMLVASRGLAQSNSAPTSTTNPQAVLYTAYTTNSLTLWKQGVSMLQETYSANPEDESHLLALTRAQMGLLSSTMASEDEATFKTYKGAVQDNIDKLMALNPKNAAAHAMQAELYGLVMGFSPMKGMLLGMKSSSHIEKALKYDNTLPYAWLQRGSSKLFTPGMFGGSYKEAIKSYKEAIRLLEAQADLTHNWQYLEALAWYGVALQKTDKHQEAVTVYKKALEVAPDFNWVKYSLLPSAEKGQSTF